MSDRVRYLSWHVAHVVMYTWYPDKIILCSNHGISRRKGRRASIGCLPLTMSFDWLIRNTSVPDTMTNIRRHLVGVAYVKYEKASSAALAVENLHEVTLNNGSGPRLKVMLAESPSARCVSFSIVCVCATIL